MSFLVLLNKVVVRSVVLIIDFLTDLFGIWGAGT